MKTLPLIVLSAAIYLLYAKLEEEHGLARHAMAVYERACSAVPTPDKYEVSLYVSHKLDCDRRSKSEGKASSISKYSVLI